MNEARRGRSIWETGAEGGCDGQSDGCAGESWYLLAHTEGYRVDGESGERVGVVDRVQWSEGRFEFEPKALVVRSLSSAREVVVPLDPPRGTHAQHSSECHSG